MRNLGVGLLWLLPLCLLAQTKPVKQSLTTRDLNKLETEKIRTTDVKPVALKKDTTKTLLVKPVLEKQPPKKDTIRTTKSLSADSVKHQSGLTVKPPVAIYRLSKDDSVRMAGFEKNKKIADSIYSLNKHWLDSTLQVLPAKKPVQLNAEDEIEIFISGGGLYTGVNPVKYDRLTIYNSGLVRREWKTKLQPEQTFQKKLTKEQLRKLAQFIIDQGYFDFNNVYDCQQGDKACATRLLAEPQPIALSLSVSVGMRRKRVYVALYAPHLESNWVNYPPKLEKIVNAIYEVVEQ